MHFLKALGFGVCLVVVLMLVFVAWFAFQTRPRRGRELGFEYIFVEDDGTARELDSNEREYLERNFHPADGARP
jgi:uncharacterized membrane protein YukC